MENKVWGIFERDTLLLARKLGVHEYQFMAVEKLKKAQKKHPHKYNNYFVGSILHYKAEGDKNGKKTGTRNNKDLPNV